MSSLDVDAFRIVRPAALRSQTSVGRAESPTPAVLAARRRSTPELARATVEGVDFRRFSESQQLQDAVIRRIEIIGEAVNYLGPPRLAADTRVAARAACSGRTASAERVTRRGGPVAWGSRAGRRP